MVGPAPVRLRMIGVVGTIDRCMQLLRHQHVEVQVEQKVSASPTLVPALLSRAQRAHYRLSWSERLARNARGRSAPAVAITLFGVPLATARVLGLSTA